MLRALHIACVAVLLAAHPVFLARGIYLRAAGTGPGRVDRIARMVSQIALMASAVSGIALLSKYGSFLPHGLLGLLPIVAIPAVSMVRLAAGRTKRAAWLLPVVNLVLIAAALVTGITS